MSERVLVVQARVGDESAFTGGLLALLARSGGEATVVTCLREGPAFARPRDESALSGALAVLRVADHRWLGGAGARRPGLELRSYGGEDAGERSILTADIGEVAADVASAVIEVQPDVVVSWDEVGAAADAERARVGQAAQRAASVLGVPFYAIRPEGSPADGQDLRIDIEPVLPLKRQAMRAVGADADSATATERFVRRRAWAASEREPWTRRAGIVFAALVAGMLVGLLGTLGHQHAEPLGLLLGLVAAGGLVVGARLLFGGRAVASAASLGVVGTIGILALPGGGGSVLIPESVAGYVWLFGPAAVAAVTLGWPHVEAPRSRG